MRGASWFVTAYILGALLGAPIFARISTLWHRGKTISLALALFGLGGLLVAASNAYAVIVVGRVLQGMGGCCVVPLGASMVASIWPHDGRGRAIALLSVAYGIGFLLGVGAISLFLLWTYRAAYLSVSCVALVLAYATRNALPGSAEEATHSPLDWQGMVTWIVALLGFSFALSNTTGAYSRGPGLWVPLSVGACALAAFIAVEARCKAPLLPSLLIKDSRARALVVLSLGTGLAQICVVQLPSLLIVGLGISPAMSGPLLLPLVVGGLIASAATTMYLDKVGPKILKFAGVITILLCGSLGAVGPRALWSFELAAALVGFGVSSLSGGPLRYVAAELASSRESDAMQSAIAVMTNVGVLLGGALFGALSASQSDAFAGLRYGFQAIVMLIAVLSIGVLWIPGGPRTQASSDVIHLPG